MTLPESSTNSTEASLFAVVLAAGMATRYGSTKQLATWRGRSLVGRALESAEGVCGANVLLVVGCDWRRVYEAAGPIAGFLVRNERYEEGMGRSIASAVAALPRSAAGALILLADQPLIGSAELARLADAWRQDPATIVCSHFGKNVGPPVIFPSTLFGELLALEGDRGARTVIERHRERVRKIELSEAATDIDSPDDLDAIDAGPSR